MNFKINEYYYGNRYYIDVDNLGCDDDYMAQQLGLSYEEYITILKKYKATMNSTHEYEFRNRCDAEKALIELTPYIVMAKLTEK